MGNFVFGSFFSLFVHGDLITGSISVATYLRRFRVVSVLAHSLIW